VLELVSYKKVSKPKNMQELDEGGQLLESNATFVPIIEATRRHTEQYVSVIPPDER